ncbi:hypothetical protein [Microbacterium sp. 22242]|uniref:hypothetical protein n=1 Tax=Microbacterium sp. 22242 TaxID=3453896 RepID=UPI003F85CEE8
MDLEGLIASLERLPVVPGLVWRGARVSAGSPLTLAGPLAVSRDLRVASENLTTPVVYAIQSVAAHDLGSFGAHPAEEEAVLLPPSTLVPAGAPYSAGALTVQPFIELRQGFATPSAPTVEQITAAVSTVGALPAVSISRPGRFVDA